MRKVGVLLVLLALALGGCASRATGKQPFDSLVYTVSGGIAGLDQRLYVGANGLLQLDEKGRPGKAGKLSPDEVRRLRELAAKVDWTLLQEQYVNPRMADAIYEGVTLKAGKKTYAVLVGTGAEPPGELAGLLARLNQVLIDHR